MDDASELHQDAGRLSLTHSGKPHTIEPCENRPIGRFQSHLSPHQAQDVTESFKKAAATLKTGDLVKDEDFTLFEAVGALEIMDLKMDSGFLAPGETLDDDYDILQELSPDELLGVMDQILSFEMAWHVGYPLSQTLFTSLYIESLLWPEPKDLEQARFDRNNPPRNHGLLHGVLRPFCLGVIKACDFVLKTITAQHFYEEEDFVSSVYNRPLLSSCDVNHVLESLQSAKSLVNDGLAGSTETTRSALLLRLDLRVHLLKAMDVESIVDLKRADHWSKCLKLLPDLQQTYSLGTPIPASFSGKLQRRLASTVPPRPIVKMSLEDAHELFIRLCTGARQAYGVMQYYGATQLHKYVVAFQSQKPQTPTYVRSLTQCLIFNDMKVLGTMSVQKVIFDHLEELVLPADVLLDTANSEIEAPQDPRFQVSRLMDEFVRRSAEAYLDIFRALCMNRSRLRRMLCHVILDWDSVQYEAETIDTNLQPLTQEVPIKEPYEDLYAFPLSSWSYHLKLQQLTWIVQMGFELDVYLVSELGGMYWYLNHLVSATIQHLDRIRAFVVHKLALFPKDVSLDNTQRSSFRHCLATIDAEKAEAEATRSFAHGLSGLYAALAGLHLIPGLGETMPYSRPELRFLLRMRPFLSMSLPEVPSYTDYISIVTIPSPTQSPPASPSQCVASPSDASSGGKVSENKKRQDRESQRIRLQRANLVLDRAEQSIKTARTAWDTVTKFSAEKARCEGCETWWRAEKKDVLRSCIMAGICIATLKKRLNGASMGAADTIKVRVRGDLESDKGKDGLDKGKGVGGAGGYHPWWIIPEII